jgi:adenylate cyclase
VHFVLHGSVQRNGTKIRINAQLADANSNAQLWSESFEGDQSDLFALQDRVTTLIGNSIGRQMVIRAARESETRKSSPKVADLMLRARALKLNLLSLKNLRQSEDLYRQALALEPSNTSAMVGLAGSLATEAGNFGSQLDDGAQESKYIEARDLALRAKELDPDNPGVYYALGSYAASHGDQVGYLRARETQLSLDPRNPTAYLNLAVAAFYSGDPKRSIELTNQAINLDPRHRNELTLANLGRAYFMLGDNDAAIQWLQKSLEVNPTLSKTHAYLAMAYAFKGEDALARAETAELRRLDSNIKLSAFLDPVSTTTYREWYESKLVPAWRKAGLPE